ncbi:hypothetical protein [Massilia antarctica]|uniref:hypothetical protein n=1 Tax=Massilia antarctica TaxID=2765360 RepID=UPI0006BC9E99|nr:hypothetical protein [Massilia sp. H27-R4]CUI07190.1 hypothetical protein BN2497_9157 [Janthinobacterium sp. CG23_2]CUU30976.1 hypothetical protein BN3177_9157 [Janthinobacterium sp. CG23_2]
MQTKMLSTRTMLAALLCGASLALAGAPAMAQSDGVSTFKAVPKRAAAAAQAAAQRDFAQFVTHQMQVRGTTGTPVDFPLEINDMQDLKDAKVGYGFPVYTIDPNELLAGRGSMKQMAKATGQWRFVILLNQRPIGMATVELNNGNYETVAYGAAVLAKDVDASMGYYGDAERTNVRFVRIYQARADLLEVVGREDGRTRYAPLHSARESLLMQQRSVKEGKASEALMEEADILQPLRSVVKQTMDASK